MSIRSGDMTTDVVAPADARLLRSEKWRMKMKVSMLSWKTTLVAARSWATTALSLTDVEADAMTLASAGFGTDEDYGDCGDGFYEE